MVLRTFATLAMAVVLSLAAMPLGPAAAAPVRMPQRGVPIPPPDLPAALLLKQHSSALGDVQEFFSVPGQTATMQVGRGGQLTNTKAAQPNMAVEFANCWAEHDYAHLSEHTAGAIDAEVRTVCDRIIDRVHVTGYLWRWSGGQWWLVGSQAVTQYGWSRVAANPSVGCPGAAGGYYYYTSSGYHEVQWGSSIDRANSWSDKVSAIRCGGPY
jgi:hypothetical protein